MALPAVGAVLIRLGRREVKDFVPSNGQTSQEKGRLLQDAENNIYAFIPSGSDVNFTVVVDEKEKRVYAGDFRPSNAQEAHALIEVDGGKAQCLGETHTNRIVHVIGMPDDVKATYMGHISNGIALDRIK